MRLVDCILKWQTLIGSIIGGVFALLTALIVARSARHRDEQASGIIVQATLAAVCVWSETLTTLSSQEGLTEENYPLWFAEMVVHSHPSIPVLFDASVARLVSVDLSLAAHLSLFQQTYSQAESVSKRVADDYTYYHTHGKALRPQDLMEADCRIVTKHFQFAAAHANCAVYLISELVLARLAFWHRLRRHIWYNKKEKECKELLRKGTS